MIENDFKKHVIPLASKAYSMARRMLDNEDLANDAIQQSLLKLWEKRNQLDHCQNLKAFVFRVVRNVCLDEFKKKKPVYSDQLHLVNNVLVKPERMHERAEMVQIVKQIIETLTESQREIIQLRDIDGLEFEEIAEITMMDVPYIRVLLSRARKTVKEKLDKIYQYEAHGEG